MWEVYVWRKMDACKGHVTECDILIHICEGKLDPRDRNLICWLSPPPFVHWIWITVAVQLPYNCILFNLYIWKGGKSSTVTSLARHCVSAWNDFPARITSLAREGRWGLRRGIGRILGSNSKFTSESSVCSQWSGWWWTRSESMIILLFGNLRWKGQLSVLMAGWWGWWYSAFIQQRCRLLHLIAI